VAIAWTTRTEMNGDTEMIGDTETNGKWKMRYEKWRKI
jgi:hypothetical protein